MGFSQADRLDLDWLAEAMQISQREGRHLIFHPLETDQQAAREHLLHLISHWTGVLLAEGLAENPACLM
jgi:DNA polymerase III epsilon subunit-like protein